MIRAAAAALFVVVAASSCTLLLPTDELIVACTADQECLDALGEGFECQENACLPIDEGGEGEGEGEGE